MSRVPTSGAAPRPPDPCGRARPAPASDGVAVLARVDDGEQRYITIVASFAVGNHIYALFCPMRLRSLDSGRLFSAKIAFRRQPFAQLFAGDFAEPFPPPLRASLRARRSSLRRAPQGASRPLTRGRVVNPAPALTFYSRSGPVLHPPGLQKKKNLYMTMLAISARIKPIYKSNQRGERAAEAQRLVGGELADADVEQRLDRLGRERTEGEHLQPRPQCGKGFAQFVGG